MSDAHYLAEEFLKDVLKRHPITEGDFAAGIENYINVGELEIAFEGAFLWYIRNNTEFSQADSTKILGHGRALNLHEERSVDETSWQQFLAAFGPKSSET